jgi:DNA-PKcs, CC5
VVATKLLIALQRQQLDKHWSSAAAEQLLRLPRNDRDADAPIFSSGLAECKFQDYQINTNQQVRQLHTCAAVAAVLFASKMSSVILYVSRELQATLQMAPMFSATWSASQTSSQLVASQASQYAAAPGGTLVSRTQVMVTPSEPLSDDELTHPDV